MDRRRRAAPKGVPPHLVELKRQGKRIRYHGFWLNESKRDRMIADFIDTTDQDVAELIKEFLYRNLSNNSLDQKLDQIIQLIETMEFRPREREAKSNDKVKSAFDRFST